MIDFCFKRVMVAITIAALVYPWPVRAMDESSNSEVLPYRGPVEYNRLALLPENVSYAEAPNSSINLEDLGFSKKDSEEDASYQKTLDRRTKMLKIHQMLALATGVSMAFTLGSATDSVGERGDGGHSARNRHALLGMTTGALYFTAASFAIFAPKVPHQRVSGRTKIHRALAFIHFPAMLATMYYGITDKHKLDHGQDPSGHKSTVANIAAGAFYTSLVVMVVPFGGGN